MNTIAEGIVVLVVSILFALMISGAVQVLKIVFSEIYKVYQWKRKKK